MVLLTEQLRAACGSLHRNRNSDGGIDATHHGDLSGCWTTASALWSMAAADGVSCIGVTAIRDMANFLLNTQNSEGEDAGGWPMMPGGHACAMATGHAAAALSLARPLLDNDTEMVAKIEKAAERGLCWLEKWQNPDGGWGPQPVTGGGANKSIVFATYYALLPFWIDSIADKHASTKNRAIKYLDSIRNSEGSWGSKAGKGDISDTARALIALVRCKGHPADHPIIKRGARFLLKNQGRRGLWPLGRLEILFPKAAGVTVFSNNGSLDAIIALSLLPNPSKNVREVISRGLQWLLDSQEGSTGIWYLTSPYDPPVREMHTWPTTEWIYAVSMAASAFTRFAITAPVDIRSRPAKIAQSMVAPAMLGLGFLAGSYWRDLGQADRTFVLVTIMLAILVNIFSTFLSNWLSAVIRQIKPKADSDEP